jgi:hypothetical protein
VSLGGILQLSLSIVKSATLSRVHRTFVSLSLGASFTEHTNICNIYIPASETDICLPRPCGALCSAYDFGLLRRPRCHPRISVKWALKKEEVGEIDRVLSSIAKPLPTNKYSTPTVKKLFLPFFV